jgi:putative ABC transport system permease protein
MLNLGAIKRSLAQFLSNPLRTMLTLLGIVFGVGSVVAMVSVGEGAQREILATIEAMGARTTHIQAREVPDTELQSRVNESAGLSRADVTSILGLLERHGGPKVTGVAWRRRHTLQVTDLPVSAQSINVLAVSPSIFQVHRLKLGEGRPLAPLDEARYQRSAVLGHELARKSFPNGALGQKIRLDYAFYEVVGVLAPRADVKGELPVDPQVYDQAVLIPMSSQFEELSPEPAYGELELVSMEVGTTEETLALKRALIPILAQLHGGLEDVEIISPEELLEQRKAAQSVLNMVLISIAAISLVVGGIGIMNIMLANILERIPEIGLRRAVGARKRDIRDQFLMEAVLISVVGGLLGLVLGLGGGWIVSVVAETPFAFAWESMVLSFGISLVVGVVFGFVPALRAAGVDPIEALRGE